MSQRLESIFLLLICQDGPFQSFFQKQIHITVFIDVKAPSLNQTCISYSSPLPQQPYPSWFNISSRNDAVFHATFVILISASLIDFSMFHQKLNIFFCVLYIIGTEELELVKQYSTYSSNQQLLEGTYLQALLVIQNSNLDL